MKKMMMVVITMLLTLVCLTAGAETFDIDDYYPLTLEEVNAGILYDPVSHFSYALQADGTIRLVRYIQLDEVEIPETINGIPVSSLGRYAFFNTTVSDIFLPYTDIQIDDFAFVGCGATLWIQSPQRTWNTDTERIQEGISRSAGYRYYVELDGQ